MNVICLRPCRRRGIRAARHAQSAAALQVLRITTSFDLALSMRLTRSRAAVRSGRANACGRASIGTRSSLSAAGRRDAEGVVFTIQHGPTKAVWVNTLMDTEARHFQYVYFIPEIMVTVIDVRFKLISADVDRRERGLHAHRA